ncbi:unnamed protein product [Larinioides sclopetarius]|uniref:Rhodanese domain-containing protein n=1 Tax=Larinioides sclopetarius TaxID=280406 RepID=A0AAV2BWK8_9ARAC
MALRNFLHQIIPKYNLLPCSVRLSAFSRNFAANMSENKLAVIEFENLKDKLLKRNITLIDVREPKELKEDGKIPNSVNIPLGQIVDAFKMSEADFQAKYGVQKPDTNSNPFVLSCRSGKRATDAYQKLSALGYDNISVYSGSFLDWVKNGGPVEK